MNRPLLRRAAIAVTLTAAMTSTTSARADQNSSHVSLAANPIRSVTVDLQTLALGSCTFGATHTGDVLGFPNGVCISPVPVHVRNGGYAGHIEVATTPVQPGDHGPAWTPAPCHALTFNSCPAPGTDQFLLATSSTVVPTANTAQLVSTTPRCDYAFNGSGPDPHFTGCRVAPMQHNTEYLWLEGPASSTDLSATWSFDITWTAVP